MYKRQRVELALHAIKVVDKSNSLQDIAPVSYTHLPCGIADGLVDRHQEAIILGFEGIEEERLDLLLGLFVVLVANELVSVSRKLHGCCSSLIDEQDGHDAREDVIHRDSSLVASIKRQRVRPDWQEGILRYRMRPVLDLSLIHISFLTSRTI